MKTLYKIDHSGNRAKIMSFKSKKAAILFLHTHIANMKTAALAALGNKDMTAKTKFRYNYNDSRIMNDYVLNAYANDAQELVNPIYVNPSHNETVDTYHVTYDVVTHYVYSRKAITTAISERDINNWNVLFCESNEHVTFEIV